MAYVSTYIIPTFLDLLLLTIFCGDYFALKACMCICTFMRCRQSILPIQTPFSKAMSSNTECVLCGLLGGFLYTRQGRNRSIDPPQITDGRVRHKVQQVVE